MIDEKVKGREITVAPPTPGKASESRGRKKA
jgi:hypothetical protein